jgi:hypothetical protein
VGRVKVELSPVVVDVVVEPTVVPPLHVVAGGVAWQRVQATKPVGGPPIELPVTVAVSPQEFPTAVSGGGRIVVVKSGSAGVTVKHSVPVCCGTGW